MSPLQKRQIERIAGRLAQTVWHDTDRLPNGLAIRLALLPKLTPEGQTLDVTRQLIHDWARIEVESRIENAAWVAWEGPASRPARTLCSPNVAELQAKVAAEASAIGGTAWKVAPWSEAPRSVLFALGVWVYDDADEPEEVR